MRHIGIVNYSTAILLLVIIFIMFQPILAASSQTSTVVTVKPSTSSARLGGSFTVNVSLSNVKNLYGLEIHLKWDPAVLRVANVDIRLGVKTCPDGVLHESPSSIPILIAENNLTQTEGIYRLVATSIAPAPSFNGSGNIVRITFEITKLGNSTLDLESQLFDYPPTDRDPRISLPISHSAQDAFVTVIASNGSTQTDNASPEIRLLSPLNKTYYVSSVSLVFTVNKPFNWAGYSLDGKENVTVTGNVTLANLSDGSHSITVYANDTSGNMGASKILEFIVAASETEPELFPVVPVAAAVVVVAVSAGVVLIVNFRKRRVSNQT